MTTQHAKSNAREGDGVAGHVAVLQSLRAASDSGAEGDWLNELARAQCVAERAALDAALAALQAQQGAEPVARPAHQYHEDYGPVTWWKFPVDEPAWIGSPSDSDWPGYHTHFTPHPAIPGAPR